MAKENTYTESCGCNYCNGDENAQSTSTPMWKRYIPSMISAIILAIGLTLDYIIANSFFNGHIRLACYLLAYLPVGVPVAKKAFDVIREKDWFNEFTLMTIATLGAFSINEYPEGVAVMLFYSIGELFQESAVNKARNNIKALLDIRPKTATVFRNGSYQSIDPATVNIGEQIQIKAGEKVPLDGTLLSPKSSFNTSALTGESTPKTYHAGNIILAGMLNLDHVIEMRVEKEYEDSSLAKILALVQNATARKAKSELLIRKLARIYTPIVFLLALLIATVPFFFVDHYEFSGWLYRALVFLVISCPCALVISIPLGYFGGIGAASRNGILFKGANYLDMMTQIDTIVMDKTGTITEGVFEVQNIVSVSGSPQELTGIAASTEQHSNHPIAKAICEYNTRNEGRIYPVTDVKEIAGHGLKAVYEDKTILIGNTKLMNKHHIAYDPLIDDMVETVVIIAFNGSYAGYITIADRIKKETANTIKEIKRLGIEPIMLSGDGVAIVRKTGEAIGVSTAIGGLLPEDKSAYIEQIKASSNRTVAFVGDGINDAPALAVSDVGIAMGGMGADAAIEVADVVIQTDRLEKIITAIQIGKTTQRIIKQNIIIVLTIKAIILLLGALGVANMWEAVFADVGVALVAILNSIKVLRKRFR